MTPEWAGTTRPRLSGSATASRFFANLPGDSHFWQWLTVPQTTP
ncbi:hypothetical protein [[Phormidium] sp. ETS-05]|nr:hypothetical protein [[Phormidium] sp. ETS-05]